MRRLRNVAFSLIGFYLLLCVAMFGLQRHFMYFPTSDTPTPEAIGLRAVSTISLATPDGQTLELWWAPPLKDAPTVLYFHGNAGSIAARAQRLADFHAAGFGVALLSWRGFGNSTGTPSEPGLMTDAASAYDWLAQQVDPATIALVGESLGTGPAVQLAAKREVGALLLGAPYTATVDVAAETYPWLPVRVLMKDRFLSREHIRDVLVPIHISHGTADTVIPYHQGQALAAMAKAPVTFNSVPGAGHEVTIDRRTTAAEIAFIQGTIPSP